MERGFNACQTHRSMYPSIFNRLRAIAGYWSEIATFSYPLHLMPPLGCSHWNSEKKFGHQKTRIMGLPGNEDSLSISWAVSTQYQRVIWTDGRTDGQPIAITCAVWLTHVKNHTQIQFWSALTKFMCAIYSLWCPICWLILRYHAAN